MYSLSFAYRLSNGELVRLADANGWCSGCGGIVLIEHLPTSAEVTQFCELLSAVERGPTGRGLLAKLWGLKKSAADADIREYSVKCAKDGIRTVQFRKTHPKCLWCGSQQITDLTDEQAFIHPGCGGSVHPTFSRSLMDHADGPDVLRVYDADCNFLVELVASFNTRVSEREQQQLVTDALDQKKNAQKQKVVKQVEQWDMPDISKLPEQEFQAGQYRIRFLKHCRSIKESFRHLARPRYIFVMVVIDTVEEEFVHYVSIERAGSRRIAREFNTDGEGQTLTPSAKWEDEAVFVRDSLARIAERFNVRIVQ